MVSGATGRTDSARLHALGAGPSGRLSLPSGDLAAVLVLAVSSGPPWTPSLHERILPSGGRGGGK